ncbi:MAG: cytochrome c oxidase assembly protein [Chloroflexota bacterium]
MTEVLGAGIGLAYALLARRARLARRPAPSLTRVYAFLAGVAVLTLASSGVFDAYAHRAFSAHMLQHMLFMIAAAPLVSAGRPLSVFGIQPRPGGGVSPGPAAIVAAIAVNALLLVWHLPVAYEAALLVDPIHAAEHLLLFGASVLYWLILGGDLSGGRRPSSEVTLLTLFATWMACDLLGAVLTLSEQLYYPWYALTPKPGDLSPIQDQRLGGLVMWVGGGVFYAVAMLLVLIGLRGGARRSVQAAE